MSQAKARLLELNAKLAQTLVDKGVEATADETTTALINKVSDISNTSDDTYLRALTALIQRDITDITIPDGMTSIGDYIFYRCYKLKSITIPGSIMNVGAYAFLKCISLTSIDISANVTSVGEYAFEGCTGLTSAIIGNGVVSIGSWAFANCRSLTNVSLENGFNANGLDLSASTKYTAETIVSWLNALADRTGQTAYTLTIGTANLAKLTEEQIAVATAKNWTLA